MRSNTLGLTALIVSSALVMSSCASGDSSGAQESTQEEKPQLATSGPEVLTDPDGSGAEVSARLFESSDVVVVSTYELSDQLQAAAVAKQQGAPMLTRLTGNEAAVDAEIERLGATQVIEVPGEDRALEDTEPVVAAARDSAVEAIAAQEGGEPSDLQMPPMLATPHTSLAAAATAAAAGAEIQVLSVPDPRETSESMRTVTEQDTLALGAQFGSSEEFGERVELANNGELPGGGGLLFPGRRMVALYGHPSGDSLGMMGEQPPAEAVDRLEGMIEDYQALEEQPVLPAFEIIVTVASEFPGDDGDYSNEGDPEEFIGYIDAITEAGGYAFLDLQPGQASFLDQAKRYEELLKRPNVGLALDPEWKIGPGEKPLQQVGHAEAAEINEVADWLAELTRENNLPQKGLILHQFQLQMLRDRDQINTDHPELAFILHADGHGSPNDKFDTWNAMRQGLSSDYFMAWKNFEDEDSPTFTPEETYNNVDPRPWFVSYQ
ncbi:cell wall-binding repeat-containing protein [Corynebacterium lubricantis]|uniref:cell wall-binding repeat-containing protein n=1 Tax=Corynebacterium lubricantis TaxID=541095 RepID=UPI0003620274|nr:cell wall-binding repeat-containing protein [Corynebacterium lubricantis]